MKLKKLLQDVDYQLLQGSLETEVDDIVYDSRKAAKKKAFVALTGFRVDGHNYIKNAIDLGSKVIITEKEINLQKEITIIKLKDTRTSLSKLSRTLFNYPDKELTTIAITGTKGKTTTATMINKILNDNNHPCGLIGTMGIFYQGKHFHTMNTTPESYDVFYHMREMIKGGITHLVMEVSSQSLKLKRFSNIIFDYGVFTNLSLDHVGEDEHDSFEDYKHCKSLLFSQCKIGLFNISDKYYPDMTKNCTCQIHTFGKNSNAQYQLINVKNHLTDGFIGIQMTIAGKLNSELKVSIPGRFTALNALASMAICDMLNISLENIKKSLEQVSVKGRMESIKISNKFSILIDYAYQGIAMENVLTTIKEANPKRIITVFGCGGNRSKQRRYDTGEISGKYADLSILTADNPRYEDNDDIIKDILVGMNKTSGQYVIIPDRKEAIKYSIQHAQEGDCILILGKGHEDYQEINGIRYPFDERLIIKEIIKNLNKEEKNNLGIIGEDKL